jgi:hypothetical protein
MIMVLSWWWRQKRIGRPWWSRPIDVKSVSLLLRSRAALGIFRIKIDEARPGAGKGRQHCVARISEAHAISLARDGRGFARFSPQAVYATCFSAERRPARTCVGATGLARGALVEIDMIARRNA